VEGDPIVANSGHRHVVGDDNILHAYNNPFRVEALDDELLMLIGAERGICSKSESSPVQMARSSSTPWKPDRNIWGE
jgi:hypothetical protein